MLFERLALKGGNALVVIHGIDSRASIDLDFSIDGDFVDIEDVRLRAQRALDARFAEAGYVVFDYKFEEKPVVRRSGTPSTWGGYDIELKVVKKAHLPEGGIISDRTHTLAENVGPGFLKRMSIQVSRNEFTAGACTRRS